MTGSDDGYAKLTPRCPAERPEGDRAGENGHAWVSGRAELNAAGELEIFSRQCRRCGYEEELKDD